MADYYYIRRALLTMAMLCAWPFLSFLNNNQEDVLIYGGAITVYALAFMAVVGVSVVLLTIIFGRKSIPRIAVVARAGGGATN